ncbi:MAG: hypothetical protein OSA84_04845 [Akkermansiaceae bacterium]|nr:hypothetical protein [Akkermansiaceae bacterium]
MDKVREVEAKYAENPLFRQVADEEELRLSENLSDGSPDRKLDAEL